MKSASQESPDDLLARDPALREAFAADEQVQRVRMGSVGALLIAVLMPAGVSLDYLVYGKDGKVGEFLALASALGDPGIDWITLVLCDSQQQEARIALAEALSHRCHDNPERLAPWLSDPRWYVVRNIVTILGWIGGPAVAGLLQTALRNPDLRVHAAVVAALTNVELKHARPVLVRAIDTADSKLFAQILHSLSGARDPATARFVFAFVQQERFQERPSDERRAIYAAVASIGGDELVTELENELLKGNWFDREQEIHRHAIARCLAMIGTPFALTVLHRGAGSKREPVRQACTTALAIVEGS